MKLDIFGEIVVTLGTVPQGQGHETTVVAGRRGHPRLLARPGERARRATTRASTRTPASRAPTRASSRSPGLGAVKGAADLLQRGDGPARGRRAAGAGSRAIELADGFARIKDGPPEAALPFMALGAIVNANNAFLPPELQPDAEPPLRLPAVLRDGRHREEDGQADADLRDADPRLRGRGRPGDRRRRDRRLRGRGRLRHRASTRRSSRARCTARPRTRSAPHSRGLRLRRGRDSC